MKPIYIIEIPGKPSREITGVNFDVISAKVEKLGGKVYRKEEPKVEPYVAPKPSNVVRVFDKPRYSWSEVIAIAEFIRDKHFANVKAAKTLPILLGRRSRRTLGYVSYRWCFSNGDVSKCKVPTRMKLSKELVNGYSSDKLEQVIYHEFCHVEFPNEGHRGMNFRNKEFHNPYRTKKSNRLTCVS